MTPKRIQRKRIKGWRTPPGAVYVGRPTVWGNPFWHTEIVYGLDVSLALYRNLVQGVWNSAVLPKEVGADIPYNAQREWLKRIGGHPLEMITELRGHDLVCWCPLDRPCHADILLELANR